MTKWTGTINAKHNGVPKVEPKQAYLLPVLAGRESEVKPRVLHLGGWVGGLNWPDHDTVFLAGLRGDNQWNSEDRRCAPAVVEYGVGAATQRVTIDWIPGVYQLPPCDAVSVSVRPYGDGWADAGTTDYVFGASVVDGKAEGAHPMTFTARGWLEPSPKIHQFVLPPHARAVDVGLSANIELDVAAEEPGFVAWGACERFYRGAAAPHRAPGPFPVVYQRVVYLQSLSASGVYVTATAYIAP